MGVKPFSGPAILCTLSNADLALPRHFSIFGDRNLGLFPSYGSIKIKPVDLVNISIAVGKPISKTIEVGFDSFVEKNLNQGMDNIPINLIIAL